MEKLKPCPFCGGTSTLIESVNGFGYVNCNECVVEVGPFDTLDKALKIWNTRQHDWIPMREAYIEGYSKGHNDTVEGSDYYCPEESADDWIDDKINEFITLPKEVE